MLLSQSPLGLSATSCGQLEEAKFRCLLQYRLISTDRGEPVICCQNKIKCCGSRSVCRTTSICGVILWTMMLFDTSTNQLFVVTGSFICQPASKKSEARLWPFFFFGGGVLLTSVFVSVDGRKKAVKNEKGSVREKFWVSRDKFNKGTEEGCLQQVGGSGTRSCALCHSATRSRFNQLISTQATEWREIDERVATRRLGC